MAGSEEGAAAAVESARTGADGAPGMMRDGARGDSASGSGGFGQPGRIGAGGAPSRPAGGHLFGGTDLLADRADEPDASSASTASGRDGAARLKRRRAAREDRRIDRETAARERAEARETAREDRLRDRRAAPAERIEPAGETVDQAIRSLMRHPRYWRDKDAGFQDHVARQWRIAYPGRRTDPGFQGVAPMPVIRPDQVEPWSPGAPTPRPLPADPDDAPIHRRPAIIKPGFDWDPKTGRWVPVPPAEQRRRAWEGGATLEDPTPLRTRIEQRRMDRAALQEAEAKVRGETPQRTNRADRPGTRHDAGLLGPEARDALAGAASEDPAAGPSDDTQDGTQVADSLYMQYPHLADIFDRPGAGGAAAGGAGAGAALGHILGDALTDGDQGGGDAKPGSPPPGTIPAEQAPGILENRKARDSSKNEKHGDGGRALDGLEQRLDDYRDALKNAKTHREKRKIREKMKQVRRKAERNKKGETHGKRPKGNR